MGQPFYQLEAFEPRRLLAGSGPAQLVAQIDTTTLSSSPGGYVEMNGVAYFAATTPASGYELWRSDGTAGGTWQVKDVTSGKSDTDFRSFLPVGNTLYFLRNLPFTT